MVFKRKEIDAKEKVSEAVKEVVKPKVIEVSQSDKDQACGQCVYNYADQKKGIKTSAKSGCDKYSNKSECALLKKLGKTVILK